MYTNYWKCITNLFIFILKNSSFQVCLFYSRIKRDIAVLHKKIPGGKYMRLRNIRGSKETIAASDYVVQEPETHKGTWGQLFGNEQPVQIEVGMGKGRFIMVCSACIRIVILWGSRCMTVYCSVRCRRENSSKKICQTCILSVWMHEICRCL